MTTPSRQFSSCGPVLVATSFGIFSGERLGGALDGQEVLVLQFVGADGQTDSELVTAEQAKGIVTHILEALCVSSNHKQWAATLLAAGKEG